MFVSTAVYGCAQSTSNRDNIENWISNQISTNDSAPILIAFDYEVPGQAPARWIQSLKGTVGITAFSLKSCQLKVTYTAVLIIFNQSWDNDGQALLPVQKRDYGYMASYSADLKDMQPSRVSTGNLPYSTTTQTWADAKCSAPEPDCRIPSISLTAKGNAVQYATVPADTSNLNATGPGMTAFMWFPISTAIDGPRFVKAFHDEVVACGGTDVNKTLY
jgi:hypothetical protein